MARSDKRHNDRVPFRSVAHTRIESGPDGEWLVRSVPGSASTKTYRCPGCDQTIPSGVAHVVAWPADVGTVEDRRHWHAPCWAARLRRRPGRPR